MRRREFIAGLESTAAWPLAAWAQQPKMPLVGLLSGASFEGPYAVPVAAIRQGLRETGFVEGQNLAIEYRHAGGQYERLQNWRPIFFEARWHRSFDAGTGRHGGHLDCSGCIRDGIGCDPNRFGQQPQQAAKPTRRA